MDGKHRTQELKHTMDILGEVTIKIKEAETRLKGCGEEVRFLEKQMFNKTTQLLSKAITTTTYQDRVIVVEKEWASLSAGAKMLKTRRTAKGNFLDGLYTATYFRKIAKQQRAIIISYECAKLLADMAVIETEFCRCHVKKWVKTLKIRAILEGEAKKAINGDNEHAWLSVSEKSVKHRLPMRSEDCQEVKDLKYHFGGSAVNEDQAKRTIEPLQ